MVVVDLSPFATGRPVAARSPGAAYDGVSLVGESEEIVEDEARPIHQLRATGAWQPQRRRRTRQTVAGTFGHAPKSVGREVRAARQAGQIAAARGYGI